MKKRAISILLSLVMVGSLLGSSSSAYAASGGWQQDEKGYWYASEDGSAVKNDWRQIDGYWYLFDENGYMCTGWQTVSGYRYYLYDTGVMAHDTTVDGVWLNHDGTAASEGWVKGSGGWWYEYEDGSYPWEQWKDIDGQTYYFGYSGYMYTGWLYYDGNYYYLNTDGTLARDTWIGNDYVDKDGIWSESANSGGGWLYKNRHWYYYLNGVMVQGWLSVGGGNWYYFYTENDGFNQTPGTMATDVYVDDWYVTPVGIANESTAEAKKIVDSHGRDLHAAYNWAATLSYSGRHIYLESWGSGALAHQGYSQWTGNCFVMAASFYNMALCLGYNAHQVSGFVGSRSGGLAPHSWVEIDESDGTWVYDPNRTMETGVDAWHIYYGKPGSWMYQQYHRMN